MWSLSSGAVLQAPQSCHNYPSYIAGTLFLHNHFAPNSPLLFWDRFQGQFTQLDMGKWRIYQVTNGAFYAERGTNECLFWHISLGLGVRSDLQPHTWPSPGVYFRNGSFFVYGDPGHRLYIVPLLTYEGEEAAARARPLPSALPAEIPFVRARVVHTAPKNMPTFASSWSRVQTPPVFFHHQDLFLCV